MILGIVVVAALLAGFLAGLVSFKKTNEFCGRHGVTRQCPLCEPVTTVTQASPSSVVCLARRDGRAWG